MKYIYDRDTDSLSIVFVEGHRYRDSEEIHDGVIVDYDTAGHPIAIEFTDRASRYVDTEGLASGREVHLSHPDIPEKTKKIGGALLRLWRERLGMTQEQLATALDVGKNTIARWERDELRIEHPRMLELALRTLTLEKQLEKAKIIYRPEDEHATITMSHPLKGTVVFRDAATGRISRVPPQQKNTRASSSSSLSGRKRSTK
jgi:transcriptional regulator with XRE-family HTH domain/uncharacterized protein YuzE